MISTFHGIEVGKRGLQVHQQGMHVLEHNVSNASTEGYSRQRITFETFDPLYQPGLARENRPGQIGQGTVVQRITRVRNAFIDDRIMQETSNMGYWDKMQFMYKQLEQLQNEPSKHTIRNNLDKFWKSWQKLSQNPDDRATRTVVRETGVTLARSISKNFDRLSGMQSNIDDQLRLKVQEINNFAKQISGLNEKILQSKQVGDNPNDLLDKRDLMVEKLSRMVNVNVVRKDPDEFMVYIGSQYLVQGTKVRKIAALGNAQKNGLTDIRWADNKTRVKLEKGEITALLNMRDKVIGEQIRQFDNMAINLMDLVNESHKDGFGTNGKTGLNFFNVVHLVQNRSGNYDSTGDGIDDKTILFKISGTKKVDPNKAIGSSGILNFGPKVPGGKDVLIRYNPQDKVKDVVNKINKSDVGVVAYFNHRGRLAFKASLPDNKQNMNFVIRRLEDSGDLLVGISGILRQRGAQGAYDWSRVNQVTKLVGNEKDYTVTPQYHPSRWVDVSDAVRLDVNNIAAAQGTDTDGDDKFDKPNGLGDGNNALVISKYRFENGMIGEKATFNKFFTGIIGKLGADSRDARTHFEKSKLVMKHLEGNRKAISGVSMDEEMANMVMFQHGYNASARFIKTLDQMLNTVINRLMA